MASSSQAAEPAIPPSGAASSSCEIVHAVPAEPKRNAKRKSSDAASLEHLYQDALRQKTSNNNHVQILEYVHDLGHYPAWIPGHGCAEPTYEQRIEDLRRQQIERMWTDLPRTYTRYLEALKKTTEEHRQHSQDDQKRQHAEDVMDQIRALGREPLSGHLYKEKQNENQVYRKVTQEEKMRDSLQAS